MKIRTMVKTREDVSLEEEGGVKTYEQAVKVWNKTPNEMILFVPNTHPKGYPDLWVLANKFKILGIGHSPFDIKMLKKFKCFFLWCFLCASLRDV